MRKIISGGQTGVELAALDVATHLGLPCGGWAPRGLRNEAGGISKTYGLRQVSALGYQQAMERNIVHSDGTLLVTRGKRQPEARFAVETALKHQRQFLHIDLSQHSAFEAASLISSWIKIQNVQVLFVTGPAHSQDPRIYGQVKKILETAFYLEFVKTGLHPTVTAPAGGASDSHRRGYPRTVDDAVAQLKGVLPLKDRTLMANMQADELDRLRSGLGEYIKQHFGLYSGNEALLNSCAERGPLLRPIPEEACAVILRALWEDLRTTHRLRLIK